MKSKSSAVHENFAPDERADREMVTNNQLLFLSRICICAISVCDVFTGAYCYASNDARFLKQLLMHGCTEITDEKQIF
jgi:hypothetical protein